MNKNSTIPLHTGREIPTIGLGTWQLTDNTADMIAYALALGYPMIDTSSDYGTHEGIGDALKQSPKPREEVYIVTKVEETDDAYEASKKYLDEMDQEYADLILIHRPPPDSSGETLWEGLIRAREENLTRDIGVSNYSSEKIDKLIEATGEVPAVNQIEWSPFGYSKDTLDHAKEKGIVIQAYSPLTRTKKLDNAVVSEIADKHGKSPAQVLLRWNLQIGTVPIPKASRKEHLEENVNVFDFELSDEDMKTLNGLNEHYSSLGELPYVYLIYKS